MNLIIISFKMQIDLKDKTQSISLQSYILFEKQTRISWQIKLEIAWRAEV